MILSDGLATLDLTVPLGGGPGVIRPTLVWDEESVILVDTAVPGQLEAIRAAMEAVGVPFARLTKVVITHQDLDHIGSLPEVVAAAGPGLEVVAHQEAKPYIEGEKPLIKLTPERVAAMVESTPPDQRPRLRALLASPPRVEVTTTVVDGQRLPECGGITVIFTPGHTPDHISLYLHRHKALIAGDALTAAEGQLFGPRPQVTPDMATASASLAKFARFDIATVICYHGGVVKGNVAARLSELASAGA